jgi:hypothetical protein
MADRGEGFRERYNLTTRELIAWALLVGIPFAILLVGFVAFIVVLSGPSID